MTGVTWLHEAFSAEGQRFRIGRRATTRVAVWDDLLRLEAPARGAARVHCARETLATRKLRQGAVPALLGHLDGNLHWHAAASTLPNAGAVMFLGDAGAGKSTLAAGLGSVGGGFLGDDVTRVEHRADGWTAVRTESRHALRPDVVPMLYGTTAGSKALFVPERRRSSARLVALYDVEVGDRLELRETVPRKRVHVLQRHLVRFALDDAARLQRDLDTVLDILEAVPMYTLVRPPKFDDWQRLADTLERQASVALQGEAR